uniref:colicin E1 family microcin immunity protein n=1 Tax=Pectobacterium carotovorum TaxID=554 RepID=UPI0015E7FE12
MFTIFFLNAILFPFSKYIFESIVLKFTSKEFWNKGLFMETPARSGGELLYYLFVFLFSIPLFVIFLLKKAG